MILKVLLSDFLLEISSLQVATWNTNDNILSKDKCHSGGNSLSDSLQWWIGPKWSSFRFFTCHLRLWIISAMCLLNYAGKILLMSSNILCSKQWWYSSMQYVGMNSSKTHLKVSPSKLFSFREISQLPKHFIWKLIWPFVEPWRFAGRSFSRIPMLFCNLCLFIERKICSVYKSWSLYLSK